MFIKCTVVSLYKSKELLKNMYDNIQMFTNDIGEKQGNHSLQDSYDFYLWQTKINKHILQNIIIPWLTA